MKKAELLSRWRAMPGNQPVEPDVIPYKHRGSTFDECGIRITGTPEFIDGVLSRLKDMLRFESTGTRLGLSYSEAKDRKTGAPLGSYCCYVQVHQRGQEAEMMALRFGMAALG